MGTRVTLETIYEEVRKVNERLTLMEEAVEEVITKGLPEVKIQKKKVSDGGDGSAWFEQCRSIASMLRSNKAACKPA